MRDLYRSLALLETRLSETYGLSLNEAMVLCSIGEETVMAGVVVERTGLTASHASKMIRSVEEKGLLVRTLGEKDKRQMYFALTDNLQIFFLLLHTFSYRICSVMCMHINIPFF